MSEVELVVTEDADEELVARLVAAVRAGGSIGLSGGSGPRRAYEAAAEREPDWSRAELWLVDDRCVPPADDRSNFLLLQRTILDRVERAPRRVHRIESEHGPEAAAARYDAELEGVRFDLAVMGIGPDGHTASLFPNAPELEERERRAVAAEARFEPFVPRVTTTIPFLAASELMVYHVTGEEKADAVRRAFAAAPSPSTPSSLVRARRTVALLDRAAAARLHS
ncbi:MAG: 6-phosphogluconolactonase [Pseudomonadota bacterium]